MGPQQAVAVVIDTNVVVSALLFGGLPGRMVALWRSGQIRPVACREIIDEYLRVLAYPKFQLTEEEIRYLLETQILRYFDTVAISRPKKPIIAADPAGDKFLLCALAAGAGLVISGDHHLLSKGSWRGVRILTAGDFLQQYTAQAG